MTVRLTPALGTEAQFIRTGTQIDQQAGLAPEQASPAEPESVVTSSTADISEVQVPTEAGFEAGSFEMPDAAALSQALQTRLEAKGFSWTAEHTRLLSQLDPQELIGLQSILNNPKNDKTLAALQKVLSQLKQAADLTRARY